jgi:hypothetical protein
MAESRFDLGDPHFGRFTRAPEENDAAVAAARARLTSAVEAVPGDDAGGAVLDAAVDLAEALTVAGCESEAIALVAPAVRVARETRRDETLRWSLLVLATAEHYADRAADAEQHFREALGLARLSGRPGPRALHVAPPGQVPRRRRSLGRGGPVLRGVPRDSSGARRAAVRDDPRGPRRPARA